MIRPSHLRKEFQFGDFPGHAGLGACLLGTTLIIIDAGKPSYLWAAPLRGRQSCAAQET